MKIKKFKRKFYTASFGLIGAGFIIALCGLTLGGFSTRPFEETNHRWYQTVYLEDGFFTFGIRTSANNNILKIGGRTSTFVFITSDFQDPQASPDALDSSAAPR